MRIVLFVVWLLATLAAAAFAGSAWRKSRPFDSIVVRRGQGLARRYPRWMVWAPMAVLILFGAYLVGVSRDTSPARIVFLAVWMAVCVVMAWLGGRALTRAAQAVEPEAVEPEPIESAQP